MKALLIIAVAMLIGFNSNAQNPPLTKIYILNASRRDRPITLQTTTSTPITIKSKHWAIIQLSAGDSLSLLTNKQTNFIHFEKGRSYYFLANSDYIPVTVVTEKSEQEFLLSVHFNNAEKPDEYILQK